tara:strand:+ start:360 stop:1466 length:1107 start_codon:yes stop_codon:yes gene_type:complete
MNRDISTNDILDTLMNEIQFGLNGIQNNGNIVNDFMNTAYHIDELSNMENGYGEQVGTSGEAGSGSEAHHGVDATWEELFQLLPNNNNNRPSFQFTSELSTDFTNNFSDNLFSIPLYRHRNVYNNLNNLNNTNNINLNGIINNTLNTDIKTYKKVISDEGKELLKKEVYRCSEDETVVCPIMQIPFQDGDEIIRLPCNHVFTAEHILTWLETESAMCPVCRHELPNKEVKNVEEEGERESESESESESEGEREGVYYAHANDDDDDDQLFNLSFDVSNNRFIADTPLQTNIINNLYENVNTIVTSYGLDSNANTDANANNVLDLVRNYIDENLEVLVENEIKNLNDNQVQELLTSNLSDIIDLSRNRL